jgi:hypothetical protein
MDIPQNKIIAIIVAIINLDKNVGLFFSLRIIEGLLLIFKKIV